MNSARGPGFEKSSRLRMWLLLVEKSQLSLGAQRLLIAKRKQKTPANSASKVMVPRRRMRLAPARIDEPSIAGGRIGQRGGQLSRREEQCTRRCLGRETVAVPVIGRVVLPVEETDPKDAGTVVCAPWHELVTGQLQGDRRGPGPPAIE